MSCVTSPVCLASTSPTVAPGWRAPTSMKAQIQMSFSYIDGSNEALSSTLQLSPPALNRAAAASAHLPVAAVSPSGFMLVMPSVGASPSLATAKYTSTCVAAPRPMDCSQGSSIPFCRKTRSSRRSGGQASTIPCRLSFLVQTKMGPVEPAGMGSPRLTTTSSPEPMASRALPTRPPPMITAGATAESAIARHGVGSRERVAPRVAVLRRGLERAPLKQRRGARAAAAGALRAALRGRGKGPPVQRTRSGAVRAGVIGSRMSTERVDEGRNWGGKFVGPP
mmetsp:Transcript_24933/g.78959  ORF Transcript_24933/g.78959 Transcript_24933/m.78959 type:complete len:280 (+) Transcript_24933:599-1438(+)